MYVFEYNDVYERPLDAGRASGSWQHPSTRSQLPEFPAISQINKPYLAHHNQNQNSQQHQSDSAFAPPLIELQRCPVAGGFASPLRHSAFQYPGVVCAKIASRQYPLGGHAPIGIEFTRAARQV